MNERGRPVDGLRMPEAAASVFPTSLRSRSTTHTLVVSVSRLAKRELSTVSTVVNTMTRNLFDEPVRSPLRWRAVLEQTGLAILDAGTSMRTPSPQSKGPLQRERS